MQVRAAYLPEPGRIEVGQFPMPVPSDGQVLVRMELASICGSDVHKVYDDFHDPDALGLPGYPGHEGIGVVVESRSLRFSEGQKVLTVPDGDFGTCFSDHQAYSDLRVLPIPAGDPHQFVLAQQLGTVVYAMKKFWRHGPVPGQGKVATVIGAGSAGLFFLQLLTGLGFGTIIVSDVDAYRLEVARRLGADVLVDANHTSVLDTTLDVTGGRGADLIVEAVGLDSLRADAVHAVAKNGILGCFGFPERHGLVGFPTERAFRKSASVLWAGSAQAEPGLASFIEALRLISTGAVTVNYCTGDTVPLEQIADAIERARDHGRGSVKIGIAF